MQKDMGSVQRAIQILAGTYNKDLLNFEVATILSVDTAKWLCKAQLVSGSTQNIFDSIQLTAEKASNGFIQVPKVGSNVILAITQRNEVYVFMCSEVDALVFHQKNADNSYEEFVICCNSSLNLPAGIQLIDGSTNGITITSAGTITINDGSYGGIPVAPNVTTKLNNLENKVNALVTAWHTFATSYVPGSPSTAGLPPVAIDVSGMLNLTQASDIENADVIHGPK